MNLQEARELKEKIKNFYDNEKDLFVKHKLKNILVTLDPIISELILEETYSTSQEEKKNIIEYRSLFHDTGVHLLNPERVKERIKQLRTKLPKSQKCSRCPNPLFDAMKSSDEEPYRIECKPVCRDCYFDELGDFIEKYPIGGIGRRE